MHMTETLQSMSDASSISGMSESSQLVAEPAKDDGKLRNNIPMTSFNLINSIIGSGVIGVPYALKRAGIGLGIIIILVAALASDYAILLLIDGGKLSGGSTYQDVVQASFGRPGFYILTLLQFLFPFISMVSYNVIVADGISKVIAELTGAEGVTYMVLGNRQFVIALSILLFTLPLSLYRNIARLSKWAGLALLLIFFVVLVIIFRLPTMTAKVPATPNAWSFANGHFTDALGIISFAYVCHHNTFMIHTSLENPTTARWGYVTHASIAAATVFTLLFGIVGYVSFTGYTQGDLLENYCYNDSLVNVARIVYTITIMLTFPVECFVCREVVQNLFLGLTEELCLWKHVLLTAVLVGFTGAISMTTECLGIVLALNGILAACPLAYIFPSMCVIKLRPEPILSRGNTLPGLIAIFGLLIFVVGSLMIVVNFKDATKCNHGAQLPYCEDSFLPTTTVNMSTTTLATTTASLLNITV
ncbi:putative sodium-coupled neutral amino acid transporter 11 [Octopus bimaculoides]|nr:putative sodium-coupled neutral amino acid transporter 11 [Octopus bimaculoides]|eukprot:XP_014791284.1 PREDICTED: putative sodium-coupled neutral amino acid transporter 11 [Octopus bimaculoides]